MPNRKQNIAAIADACKVQDWIKGRVTVTYRDFGAVYSVAGDRPKFLTEWRVWGGSGVAKIATNQFIIDGMRLAAQREIDKRRPKQSVRDAVMEEFFKEAAWLGNGTMRFDFDPAKPGSDRTSLHIQQFGRGLRTSAAQTRDPLTVKIEAMAAMSFAGLAMEYKDAVLNGDRKVADLADDIACARFGMGFYCPNGAQ